MHKQSEEMCLSVHLKLSTLVQDLTSCGSLFSWTSDAKGPFPGMFIIAPGALSLCSVADLKVL